MAGGTAEEALACCRDSLLLLAEVEAEDGAAGPQSGQSAGRRQGGTLSPSCSTHSQSFTNIHPTTLASVVVQIVQRLKAAPHWAWHAGCGFASYFSTFRRVDGQAASCKSR